MIKKKACLFIAGMIMAQELTYTQAMAQTTAVTPAIIAGGGSGTTGFLSAGGYDINQSVTNYSQTAEKVLQNRHDLNVQDKEYLKSIGTRIAQSFNSIIEKKKAFIALSNKANTTVTVNLDEYLTQVNELNAALETIKIEIQASMLISKDTLPSQAVTIGSMKIDTGATSTIDMSAALSGFVSDLEKIINDLNAVTFKTLKHKGQFLKITGNALTPDLTGVIQMTPEEVQEAIAKIEELSVISASTQRKQQFLADLTVQKLKTFVEQVGTEEFLRFRNDNDSTFKSEAFKDLEKAFFMRSYLRRKYGMQIGAIQTTAYPRLAANTEAIFSKELIFPLKTALSSVISQVARGDADLIVAYNNARQFVEQYDKKLTPTLSADAAKKREALKKDVLPANASMWDKAKAEAKLAYEKVAASFATSEEIKNAKPKILNEEGKDVAYNSDDTGFLARVSGVITLATGQVSTTEALLAVMRLVLADIREELMISQGDWGTMQSYHFKRFMADNAQIERSVKTMCDIDPTLSTDARARAKAVTNGKVACTAAPTGLLGQVRSGGSNVLTQFRQLVDQYDKFEMSRAIQARNLRNMVDAAIEGGMQAGDKADDSSLMDIPTPGKN